MNERRRFKKKRRRERYIVRDDDGTSIHKGFDKSYYIRRQIHIFSLVNFEIRTFDLSFIIAYNIGTRRKPTDMVDCSVQRFGFRIFLN